MCFLFPSLSTPKVTVDHDRAPTPCDWGLAPLPHPCPDVPLSWIRQATRTPISPPAGCPVSALLLSKTKETKYHYYHADAGWPQWSASVSWGQWWVVQWQLWKEEFLFSIQSKDCLG